MMLPSPEDKPFVKGFVGRNGVRCAYRTWSAEEWARIPPDRRPRKAIPFGNGWVELIDEARPSPGPPVGDGRVAMG